MRRTSRLVNEHAEDTWDRTRRAMLAVSPHAGDKLEVYVERAANALTCVTPNAFSSAISWSAFPTSSQSRTHALARSVGLPSSTKHEMHSTISSTELSDCVRRSARFARCMDTFIREADSRSRNASVGHLGERPRRNRSVSSRTASMSCRRSRTISFVDDVPGCDGKNRARGRADAMAR